MRYIIISFFFLLICPNVYAEDFATINYNIIFEKSSAFQNFLKELEKYKKKQVKKFNNTEKQLLKQKTNLDNSQLILSEKEMNKQISEYETNIKTYQNNVQLINDQMFTEIENAKNFIRKEVTLVLQELAIENNIKIIFDENNYIVAIKKIDLTDQVIKQLNLNKDKIKFTILE